MSVRKESDPRPCVVVADGVKEDVKLIPGTHHHVIIKDTQGIHGEREEKSETPNWTLFFFYKPRRNTKTQNGHARALSITKGSGRHEQCP